VESRREVFKGKTGRKSREPVLSWDGEYKLKIFGFIFLAIILWFFPPLSTTAKNAGENPPFKFKGPYFFHEKNKRGELSVYVDLAKGKWIIQKFVFNGKSNDGNLSYALKTPFELPVVTCKRTKDWDVEIAARNDPDEEENYIEAKAVFHTNEFGDVIGEAGEVTLRIFGDDGEAAVNGLEILEFEMGTNLKDYGQK
jgi:hypothetical protein